MQVAIAAVAATNRTLLERILTTTPPERPLKSYPGRIAPCTRDATSVQPARVRASGFCRDRQRAMGEFAEIVNSEPESSSYG